MDPYLEVARSLALDRAAVDVVDRLAGAGVRDPILLKGASVARWLYADGGRRTYVDVDVLVHPDDEVPAGRALLAAGFRRRPGTLVHDASLHAEEWRHPDLSGELDLHTTIVGSGRDRATTVDVLHQHTETFPLAGREVLVLDEAARALHVVLHVAQDRLQHAKKLEDLRRLLALPDAPWDEVLLLAQELRATAALRAGLDLLPQGRRLARSLDLPRVDDAEVLLRAAGHGPAPVRLEHLRKVPGWAGRRRYVAEQLWPPREVFDPDRRHGRWWSVATRLRRLARLVARAPGTLWTWWRARRITR